MTDKIEHNGKLYELNKNYASVEGMVVITHVGKRIIVNKIGDDSKRWGIDEFDQFYEIPTSSLGKVEDAPVKLEDDCWYEVKCLDGEIFSLIASGNKLYRYKHDQSGVVGYSSEYKTHRVEIIRKIS